MRFKQVFDNLCSCQAYGCYEETDSVSRRLCFEPLFFDLCNVKENLRMIARNNLLQKSYLVCSDINERYDIG